MSLKELINSNETRYILLFGLVLLFIGIGLHFAGKTVLNVEQLYCRSYYPWKALHPEMNCSQEREADNIFESTFISRELDYLSENPHQQSYTERLMNGYPIDSAYTANQYSLTRILHKFLSIPTTTNFIALTLIFVSFLIGYLIARTLKFAPRYATLFGWLTITCSYVFLIEEHNIPFIGFGLISLGALQYYFYDRRYLFLALSFAGAILVVLSAFFQLYIYAALSIPVLGVFSWWSNDRKKCLTVVTIIGILFVAATLFLNLFILEHASFLKVANKITNEVTPSEFIKHKDYSFDPVGWMGYEPIQINRRIVAKIFGNDIGYYKYGAVTIGHWSPGPVFVILFIMGLFFLWKNKYRVYPLFMLFWLGYASGYLHLILSIIIGPPFTKETSIKAFNLVFLAGSFAVVYAIKGLLDNRLVISRKWKFILAAFFVYLTFSLPILVALRYKGYGVVLIESICITVSSILFLVWFYIWRGDITQNKKRIAIIALIISLVLPSFGRLFLRANPGVIALNDSSLYYPETEFKKIIEKHPEINRVSLIQTPLSGRIQEQNGPVFLGVPTITGYRNPMYRHYTDLYFYHRFIFEGSKKPTDDFVKFKKDIKYLNNDLSVLRAPKSEIQFSRATKLLFSITGTNAVIGSTDLNIKSPGWKKVAEANNLSLWITNSIPKDFFFTQKEVVIPKPVDQLNYMFNSLIWDPQQSTIVENSVIGTTTSNRNKGNVSEISIIDQADGYRLINLNTIDSPGILTLPVTYDKHWKATYVSETGNITQLRTFVSNEAFLGILVPVGSGLLKVTYDDSPNMINYILSSTGLLIFIFMLIYFSRVLPKQPLLLEQG